MNHKAKERALEKNERNSLVKVFFPNADFKEQSCVNLIIIIRLSQVEPESAIVRLIYYGKRKTELEKFMGDLSKLQVIRTKPQRPF